jgi:D-alanine-D-alanine ligase
VHTTDELQAALMNAFSHADSAIIEEYIKGREAACSVIDRFNNEEFYAMPPVQVIQKAGSRLYDYDAKYKDGPEAICPGEFSLEEADAIRDIAKRVHQALGLRHYSKSDFIVHPKRGIYFLEANSQPKFGHSTFTTGANGARIPMADIIDHIVQLALSS